MALNKRQKRTAAGPPDEAAFTRLIHDGLADMDDVIDAYEHVLGEWLAAGGQSVVEVVQERPVIDPEHPPTVSALSVLRWRSRLFLGGDAR